MAYITFGGKAVLDAETELANLERAGWPSEMARRANSFVLPIGEQPGRGWLLMRRADIDALDKDAAGGLPLVFGDNFGGTVRLERIRFLRARRLTPGYSADPSTTYLVEVADSRWLDSNPFASGTPVTEYPTAFGVNVRAPCGPDTYYADSVSGGTALTWQQLLDFLAGRTQISANSPTLPFTPDGTPEGFCFDSEPAWATYNAVLERLGCAVVADPIGGSAAANAYRLVRLGATDTAFTAATTQYAARLLFDAGFVESKRCKVPNGLYVFHANFNRDRGIEFDLPTGATNWLGDGGPRYTAGAQTVDATSTSMNATVGDDLPAATDEAGSLTNAAAITSRDAERTADYLRLTSQTYLRRVYSGFIGNIGFRPGSQVSAVAWSLRPGEGARTEIVRVPLPFVKLDIVSGPGARERETDLLGQMAKSNLAQQLAADNLAGYPEKVHVIKITAASPVTSSRSSSHSVYEAEVYVYKQAALVLMATCWVVDAKGATSLTAGTYYLGRLFGYDTATPGSGGGASTRPRFVIVSGTSIAVADLPSLNGLASADPDLADLLAGYDSSGAANAAFNLASLLALAGGTAGPGRLALASGVPVPNSDTTSATRIYYTLTGTQGDKIALWDGTREVLRTITETAIDLGTLTSAKNYDVFAFTSSATPSSTNTGTDIITFASATGWQTGALVTVGTTGGGLTAGTTYFWNAASSTTGSLHTSLANALAGSSKVDLTASITATLTAVAMEFLAWSSDTARATDIAIQGGAWRKSGDKTRHYLGSFRTTSTTTTELSRAKLFLFNACNRVEFQLEKLESTGSWNYNTATYHYLNASSSNRVEVLWGLPEGVLTAHLGVTAVGNCSVALVMDGGTAPTTPPCLIGYENAGVGNVVPVVASVVLQPSLGYHYVQAYEIAFAASSFYSNSSSGGNLYLNSGIEGTFTC